MIDVKPGWIVKAIYNGDEVEAKVTQVYGVPKGTLIRLGFGDPLDIGPEACMSVTVQQRDITQVIDISGEIVVERVAEYHLKEMEPVTPGGPMGQPFSSRTKPIPFGSADFGDVEHHGEVPKTRDPALLSFITERPRAALRSSEPEWA